MADPGRVFRRAAAFRAELLRGERAAASEIVRAYGNAWKHIEPRVRDLSKRYYEAENAGERISPSWLFQLERLQSVQRQIESEIAGVVQNAEVRIRAEQWNAVEAARRHAEALVEPQLPDGISVSWSRLNREAVADLVGFTSNGSPLRELLDELPEDAGAAVREALISGVVLGQSPYVIARRSRAALGGNMARALRISRTEVMRSYREATLRNYQANAGIVTGWVWHSAVDTRTCPACWAMHGTEHGLDERLDDHVQGRCAMVPRTKSWAELGFAGVEETSPQIELGTEAFARLDEAKQRAILGPAALEAYRAGAIKLTDFVGRRTSADWGTMRYARSLKAILGEEEASRWGRVAGLERLSDEKLAPALVRSGIEPSPHLLERAARYAAGRGFDPQRLEPVDAQVVGLEREGRVLRRGDRLPALDQHFLKHVVARGEWPADTSIEHYVGSARAVLRDPQSAVMASQLRGRWRLTFMREVPESRPHAGSDWVVVEYGVAEGRWRTVYRAWADLRHITEDSQRKEIRWLRPLPNRT